MTALLRRELRGLVRCWPLWFLPPLVALAGLTILPSNAEAYMTYVYFDPQGPEQQLEAYHFDVKAVYTSGLGWAQLAAAAVGAFMVLRDPRLTGQPARPSPPGDPGPYLVAKAGVAALLGRWWAVMVAGVVPACGSLAFWNATLSSSTPLALAVSLVLSLGAAAFIFLLGYDGARGRVARASAAATRPGPRPAGRARR